MDDISLEARVEAAFTPSGRVMARLAALDIRQRDSLTRIESSSTARPIRIGPKPNPSRTTGRPGAVRPRLFFFEELGRGAVNFATGVS